MDATLSEEEQFLADSEAARVAADLHKAAGPESELDAGTTWAALDASGLVAMRAEPELADRATTMDVALCVEAFAAQVAPAPLVGPLLAVELLRLAGTDADTVCGEAGARATIALRADLGGPAGGDAGSVAFDALGARWAVGVGSSAASPMVAALPAASTERVRHETAGSADLSRVVVGVPADGFANASGAGAFEADDLARWYAFSLVTVCSDMVGAMAGGLGMAVEYAKERRQYGKPIGSFQAIQHLCAEQQVSLEASRSVTYWAAWSVDALAPGEALHAATVAKAYVARVSRAVVEAVLQVYGGIGQTWECEAHRYLRRVLMDRVVLGDERVHELAVADRIRTRNTVV